MPIVRLTSPRATKLKPESPTLFGCDVVFGKNHKKPDAIYKFRPVDASDPLNNQQVEVTNREHLVVFASAPEKYEILVGEPPALPADVTPENRKSAEAKLAGAMKEYEKVAAMVEKVTSEGLALAHKRKKAEDDHQRMLNKAAETRLKKARKTKGTPSPLEVVASLDD